MFPFDKPAAWLWKLLFNTAGQEALHSDRVDNIRCSRYVSIRKFQRIQGVNDTITYQPIPSRRLAIQTHSHK